MSAKYPLPYEFEEQFDLFTKEIDKRVDVQNWSKPSEDQSYGIAYCINFDVIGESDDRVVVEDLIRAKASRIWPFGDIPKFKWTRPDRRNPDILHCEFSIVFNGARESAYED